MVFEYRSRQPVSGLVRAPPLPIIRDATVAGQRHHSILPKFNLTATAKQSTHIVKKSLLNGASARTDENARPTTQPAGRSHQNGPQGQPRQRAPLGATNGRALKRRRKPLTIREYEADFRQRASNLELVERVFHGGTDSNQLRAALWPLIFGLVKERGRFIRKTPSMASISGLSSCSSSGGGGASNGYHHTGAANSYHSAKNGLSSNGGQHKYANGSGVGLPTSTSSPAFLPVETGRRKSSGAAAAALATGPSGHSPKAASDKYVYIEHEDNLRRWRDLERQYRSYESQWKSIQPEQELRFSVFRERKALIERDVIRSDRSHPFYADKSPNLKSLTTLLMTYMMYDFDIGYLQGMSDIAAPILYVYQGDLVKSFWVFVEVMKLFRRNFEHSQKTIHFQLNCLYRLVKLTDAKLARHLRDNDCSNCFFVFRCIVCQFKRELMKDGKTTCEHNGHCGGLSDGLASSAASSSSSCSSMSGDEDGDPHRIGDGLAARNEELVVHDCGERQVESNYNRVLNLWDTIWCVQRRHELLAKSKCVHTFTIANGKTSRVQTLGRNNQQSQQQTKTTAPVNGARADQQEPQRHSTPSPLSTHSSNGYHTALNCSNGNTSADSGAALKTNNNDNVCHNNNNNNNHRQSNASQTEQRRDSARRTSLTISRSYSYQNNISHSPGQRQLAANCQHHHLTHNQLQQHQRLISQHNGHSNASVSSTGSSARLPLNGTAGHRRHSNGRVEGSPRSGLLVNRRQSNGSICSNCSLGSLDSGSRHGSPHSCCCSSLCRAEHQAQPAAPVKQEQIVYTKETFYSSFDPNQADVPRFELTETEKFVLSLCMSLIRRERNQILASQMDASEIHQHFINPQLADDFDAFVERALEVYEYLNTDCDLKLLVRGANELAGEAATSDLSSPICADEQLPETADTYELLKDYLIISPTAYNISMTSLNNLCQKGGGSPVGTTSTPAIRRDSASRYSVSQKSWDHFLNSETLQ